MTKEDFCVFHRRLEDTFRVSIRIKPGAFVFNSVTIIGNQERVMTTIQCVFFVSNPIDFRQDNFDVFMILRKKKFEEGRVFNLIEPTQVVVKILSKHVFSSCSSLAGIQKVCMVQINFN